MQSPLYDSGILYSKLVCLVSQLNKSIVKKYKQIFIRLSIVMLLSMAANDQGLPSGVEIEFRPPTTAVD
jgi:hypothetical protein